MGESDTLPVSAPLSKRAARRIIQRAFVLVGRDRHLRQHLREASVTTLWVLQDWEFAWTVKLDRGRVYFDRRPAKHPDMALIWPTAEAFFQNIENGKPSEGGFEWQGDAAHRRLLGSVVRALGAYLRQVLRNPVDENGVPLN